MSGDEPARVRQLATDFVNQLNGQIYRGVGGILLVGDQDTGTLRPLSDYAAQLGGLIGTGYEGLLRTELTELAHHVRTKPLNYHHAVGRIVAEPPSWVWWPPFGKAGPRRITQVGAVVRTFALREVRSAVNLASNRRTGPVTRIAAFMGGTPPGNNVYAHHPESSNRPELLVRFAGQGKLRIITLVGQCMTGYVVLRFAVTAGRQGEVVFDRPPRYDPKAPLPFFVTPDRNGILRVFRNPRF